MTPRNHNAKSSLAVVSFFRSKRKRVYVLRSPPRHPSSRASNGAMIPWAETSIHLGQGNNAWVEQLPNKKNICFNTSVSSPFSLFFLPFLFLARPNLKDIFSSISISKKGVPSAERSRSVRGMGKGVSGKPYPRLCNTRRPRHEPGTFWSPISISSEAKLKRHFLPKDQKSWFVKLGYKN
jgi:hypothetical protein